MANITAISALSELERIGIKFEPASEDEVRLQCPFHEDDTPSLCLNIEKNLFICQASGCKKKGDVVTLLAALLECERKTMLVDLGQRYDIESARVINPDTVERFHEKIWEAGPLLKALYDRGVTKEDIRSARIGYHQGRITIPVYNQGYHCVNVRRYLPGAPGPEKMKNTPGYGKPRIYQPDQLKYDTVWICGGEMKALVAKRLLNPHDAGAVAVAAGEGTWLDQWSPLFKDKTIVVCMDVDDAGRKAAREVASRLHTFGEVLIATLPLDKEKHPKGDLNDYVAEDGDLLVVPTEPFTPEVNEIVEAEAVEVHISAVLHQKYIGRRVAFNGIVAMHEQNPFLIPKEVVVSCARDQSGCHQCPIMLIEKTEDAPVCATIKPNAEGMLHLLGAPTSRQQDGIKRALRVPPCRVSAFTPITWYSARDVRLSAQVTIDEEASCNVLIPAFTIDNEVELNVPHRFEGTLWPHPKDQLAVLLLDAAERSEDGLSSFSATPEELAELQVFQPEEWTPEAVDAKLANIYQDLEANVTGIRERGELHRLIDLVYHSSLWFDFDGRTRPGWVNALLLGDSSQGKTEASVQLLRHYGLGVRVECKNASAAGLIGGLQQVGNQWFVSWGVIPTHDRRLVMLEEVKGTSVETIARLTDMRSSGVAEIPKIEHRKANARTRLLFISNPRSSRQVSAYSFGVLAIEELIGGLEDVRRFDVACIVAASQVSIDVINATGGEPVEHKYTSELCRRLILWTWTLKPKDIRFTANAVKEILACSKAACDKYTETMPLVDRGTMRLKLARLALACAARTFSFDKGKLVVRSCHVTSTWGFLDALYSDPLFGYADLSAARKRTTSLSDPEEVKAFLLARRHPADVVRNMLSADSVSLQDLQDWCDLDREGAQSVLSFLVRKRALSRRRTEYRKSAAFITLLKAMEAEGIEEVDINDEF